MPMFRLNRPWVAVGLTCLSILACAQQVPAECPSIPLGSGIPVTNVAWAYVGNLSTCAAGDTVVAGHPSKLRITISYMDEDCNPRVGVPPESIYVTTSAFTGNLALNDQNNKVFADDSTDADGQTRITLPSWSGAGTVRLTFYVSGVDEGNATTTVRSADGNGDGIVNSNDGNQYVPDLNYNGTAGDQGDLILVGEHLTHSHRQVLFGTPVRRTNLSTGSSGSMGAGYESWEPTGKRIALSIHGLDEYNTCALYFVPADPSDGDTPTQFTSPPNEVDDYNPSWSPRDIAVVWDRGDTAIFRGGVIVAGRNSDDSIVELCSSNGGSNVGDILPAVSPDGQTVVFSRVFGTTWHLMSVPLSGGAVTQLTSESGVTDWNASWSPDGSKIVFQRKVNNVGTWALYTIPATGGTAALLYAAAAADTDATCPTFSPDGTVVLAAVGVSSARAIVINADDASPKAIYNFTQAASQSTRLFPRPSPDGTRTAFTTTQLYVVRRNMDLPPSTAEIRDTTIMAGDSLALTVSATDPESDALQYDAHFLPSGATFDADSHRFAWRTTTANENHSYYVKFAVTERSGGTSAQVVRIAVVPFSLRAVRPQPASTLAEGYGNPSRTGFAIETPPMPGQLARLTVFNAAGRLVAEASAPAGRKVTWDGGVRNGGRARPGVYFYRLQVGSSEARGKWTLVR